MDLDALKLLLEAQERTYKSAMDIVVEQFNSRMEKAEDKTADLIRSLEFSQAEIQDLKNEVKVLNKFTSESKSIIEGLQSRNIDMERRLNYQEDYSRRNNLRITGIAEQPGGETWEQTASTVSKILEKKLQLPAVNIERAHRVGPAVPTGPRTVVVRFDKFGEREAVLRNCRKLKGSPRDSSVGLGVLNEDAAGCVTLGGASSGGASSGESTAVARATTTAVPLGGAGCTSGGAAPGKRDQENVVREGVDQEGVDREGVRTGNDSSAGEAGGAIQPQQKVLRNRKKK
ncbi:hypothetical protein Pcinc_013271 [Petrolisthes cinctipes]|uniref:Uncharacterized protein n=1 Tax=Petrolisthes cinctipes TaxID=88211 RepID=A0AAE1KUG8_PETCI|nr:hypothetical protein Pcinc_013271 [Petrolisthes cinctipes]